MACTYHAQSENGPNCTHPEGINNCLAAGFCPVVADEPKSTWTHKTHYVQDPKTGRTVCGKDFEKVNTTDDYRLATCETCLKIIEKEL